LRQQQGTSQFSFNNNNNNNNNNIIIMMSKLVILATLTVASVLCQDRYWGSYSAVYPAGGSGSSAEVAFDVANLQEASRQSLTAAVQRAPAPSASTPRAPAPRATAPRAPAPKQQSFGQQPSRPGGYVHNPTGDAGGAYVHDTTGDHGPYYYWKLRQQVTSDFIQSWQQIL